MVSENIADPKHILQEKLLLSIFPLRSLFAGNVLHLSHCSVARFGPLCRCIVNYQRYHVNLQVPESIKRVEKISGKDVIFFDTDLLDKPGLTRIFQQYQFTAVVHFAGLKSVTESVANPMDYYEVNLGGRYLQQTFWEFVDCESTLGIW